jgi:hypothetical protein
MTNQHPITWSTDETFVPSGPVHIAAARVEKNIPDIYRLVRFRTDEGQVHLKLQGYFTWYQGFKLFGGEWKDIETVDADDLSDDKPYGQLT